jgi:hypothetical protein
MQAGVALLSRRAALRAAAPPPALRRARHAQRAHSTRPAAAAGAHAAAGATYLKELRIKARAGETAFARRARRREQQQLHATPCVF